MRAIDAIAEVLRRCDDSDFGDLVTWNEQLLPLLIEWHDATGSFADAIAANQRATHSAAKCVPESVAKRYRDAVAALGAFVGRAA